jgi:hypothetical protein
MKIGIDISQIVYKTGVSVYTKSLVEQLLEVDKDNDYLLYAGTIRQKKEIDRFVGSLKPRYYGLKLSLISPAIADFVWNKLRIISIDSILGKMDIFHSSDWTQPKTGAFKVTTIHDLAPLR